MNKRLIRNNCSKYLKPYFRNIVNTLNYSNATNRNEHAFQLLFVPLGSISMTGTEKLRKENQALRNETEELKNKLKKVSDDL